MRFLLALAAALTFVVAIPSTAYACSCASASVAQYAEDSDLVVEGEVTDRDESFSPFSTGEVTYTVAVDTVYVGETSSRLEVHTSGDGASCGLEVETGRAYVLFLDSTEDGYTGSLCGGTSEASPEFVAKVERAIGGEAHAPEAAGPEPGTSMTPYVVGGVALAGGAGLALGALMWLRRRRA